MPDEAASTGPSTELQANRAELQANRAEMQVTQAEPPQTSGVAEKAGANEPKPKAQAKRSWVFMKRREQAKTGSNNFVEVTHLIAGETPHTFTLVNGKVYRKNDTRRCLEPREGAFGTPCKLERVRAFVHPETTKQHEQWLRKESAKSKRKREAYRHEMMATPQTPRKLQTSPSTFQIEDTPAPSSSSAEVPSATRQRMSKRHRAAVNKAGGIPICATIPASRGLSDKLRVRAGVKKWPTAMFPTKDRSPQLPND